MTGFELLSGTLLPGLRFGAPWVLSGLLALPVLWWWLRMMPPMPRRQIFPAIRLLAGLNAPTPAAAQMPWWLLLLRLVLAAVLIVAASVPSLAPAKGAGRGGLLLVVDDGWAAARDWTARQGFMLQVLEEAGREDRPVMLLTTTAADDGSPPAVSGPMTAAAARAAVGALAPKPWAANRKAALAALATLPSETDVGRSVWVSDGLAGDDEPLARRLQSLAGNLSLATGRPSRQLLPPEIDASGAMTVTVRRLPEAATEPFAVLALDQGGRVLARQEGRFAPDAGKAGVALRLPVGLRNQMVRLEVEGERSASATVLIDQRWRRPTVALSDGGSLTSDLPLLGRLYYLHRALAPAAELETGPLEEALEQRQPSAVILADPGRLGDLLVRRLVRFVEGGGVLVRFAGPQLLQAMSAPSGMDDPLLPVRLRTGARALDGALSWSTPQPLASFSPSGPFAGLDPPGQGVTVRTQVLAQPEPTLEEKVWARLADGTPLVTGAPRGRGWLVLVHSSANTEWSDLVLSGTFVSMMERLVALGSGGAVAAAGPLPPLRTLDGSGRLGAPSPVAQPLSDQDRLPVPSPRHPPGYYGSDGASLAVNLAPSMPPPSRLVPPPGAFRLGLDGGEVVRGLLGPLLAGALVLALLDLLLVLVLRGAVRVLPALVLLLVLAAAPVLAADPPPARAALRPGLAHVLTGDGAADRTAFQGLKGLSAIVERRTSAKLGEPVGVDPERDEIAFYPILYWPIGAASRPLSDAAAARLRHFMRHGGMLVIDTAHGDGAMADLRRLTGNLELPTLSPLPPDHVLRRSFYLLREMPGRSTAEASVWIEDRGGSGSTDGVSPVVLGDADWGAAWATDSRGTPLFPCAPGGESQREHLYRFGINLVMYALTGNYKSDQVHLPAILERLK